MFTPFHPSEDAGLDILSSEIQKSYNPCCVLLLWHAFIFWKKYYLLVNEIGVKISSHVFVSSLVDVFLLPPPGKVP